MHARRLKTFTPFILLIVSGCAADPKREGSDREFLVTESHYDSASPMAVPETEVRCLSAEPGDHTCDQLRPTAAALLGTSTIVVDRSSLFRLTADAQLVRIARAGDGPGELRAPIALGVDAEDRIVVYDARRARLIRFAGDSLFDERPLPPPQYMREMVIRDSALFAFVLPPGASRGDAVRAAIVRLRMSAPPMTDTLALFSARANSGVGDGAMFTPRLPWQPTHIWDACPDGSVVVASTDRWSVARYRGGEVPVSVVNRGVVAVAASAADRERVFSAWLDRNPRIPAFREALRARFSEMPDRPPLVDRIVCDGPDSALLRSYVQDTASAARWDRVVDHRGIAGSYLLPSDADIVASRGDLALLLRTGAGGLGVSRIQWR